MQTKSNIADILCKIAARKTQIAIGVQLPCDTLLHALFAEWTEDRSGGKILFKLLTLRNSNDDPTPAVVANTTR